MSWSLHELELEHIEQWPTTAKALLLVLLSAILCMVGGYFFISDTWGEWQKSQQQEQDLTRIFTQKAHLAASLPAYQQQNIQLQQQLNDIQQQLPSQRDTPQVLHSLSRMAQRSAVELKGVEWQAERPLDVATALPLLLQVEGNYHQLGHFVAQVSALSRIIVIEHLEITRSKHRQDLLSMQLLANTYIHQQSEVEP